VPVLTEVCGVDDWLAELAGAAVTLAPGEAVAAGIVTPAVGAGVGVGVGVCVACDRCSRCATHWVERVRSSLTAA
jgi:hypothetical protein